MLLCLLFFLAILSPSASGVEDVSTSELISISNALGDGESANTSRAFERFILMERGLVVAFTEVGTGFEKPENINQINLLISCYYH
jgi:hypothetical protein